MNRALLLVTALAIAGLVGLWATQSRRPPAPNVVVPQPSVAGPQYARTAIVGPAWVMALPKLLGQDECVRSGRSALKVDPNQRWTVVGNLWFATEEDCRQYVATGDMPPGMRSRDENLAAGDARWPRAQDTLGNLDTGARTQDETDRRAACGFYTIAEVIARARCQPEGSG